MKLVPDGDKLVKDVQCYELLGGIAHRNHAFSFIQDVFVEQKTLSAMVSITAIPKCEM